MNDYWNKEILVLGCGNILFGDDGFGPAVIEHFEKNFAVPPEAAIINAGLSVREILINIVIAEKRPGRIIIVDAVDAQRDPGEIFEIDINDIPENKIDDFSMHQLPTSNLLKELKDFCGVDVKIFCTQTRNIPDEVCPGLSEDIQKAIPLVCEKILHVVNQVV